MARALGFLSLALLATVSLADLSSQGLDLSLDHNTISVDDKRQLGQLTCKANGNAVNVTRVAVIWVKHSGETNEVLSVTRKTPTASVSLDSGILGNGTLAENNGYVVLDQMDSAVCDSSYFLCEVMFEKPSGGVERAIATAWPKQPQNMTPGTEGSNRTSDLPSLQKRAEDMSAALEIFNMSYSNLQAITQKDKEMQAKLLSRLEQLENMSSSAYPSRSCDACSNVTQALEKLEKRLEDLEKMNKSTEPTEPNEANPSCRRLPECFRGMKETTTDEFVLMIDTVLQRPIRCDAQTDGGGWIVFHRRDSGIVTFTDKMWVDYKTGFGNLSTEFWLGNEALYNFTAQDAYELRVDIKGTFGERYNVYENFSVGSESTQYRLQVSPLTEGSIGEKAGKGLSFHNNMSFSTPDRDNDLSNATNCAEKSFIGSGWNNKCANVNPNTAYGDLRWYSGYLTFTPLFFEMKIRCRGGQN